MLHRTGLKTKIFRKFRRGAVVSSQKTPLIYMNQPRIIRGGTGKSSASFGTIETVVCNRCSYRVPDMAGINASTNKNNKLYNSIVQAISRGGRECATKVRSPCTRLFDMVSQVKTQMENDMSNRFDFWGQTIDTSNQAVFTLKNYGIHDEEVKKINISDPLTESQT